jgi:succinoglycan biosynthesis protein ExoW
MPDHRLAVIIPFFQRKPGILARALRSVGQQKIPDGWVVEVIVVDDGSPCPAEGEIGNLTFDGPLRLKVIKQEHGGVAAARNRALDEADKDTALIAFLDSDDTWPATHLQRMIRALTDYDFCFTDSRRIGHYESYLRQYASETGRYIALAEKKNDFSVIAPEQFVALMLKEFPAQASMVAYKLSIAPHLRFDTRLKAAGEDLLFFVASSQE